MLGKFTKEPAEFPRVCSIIRLPAVCEQSILEEDGERARRKTVHELIRKNEMFAEASGRHARDLRIHA